MLYSISDLKRTKQFHDFFVKKKKNKSAFKSIDIFPLDEDPPDITLGR
jgi:hypothetical protein